MSDYAISVVMPVYNTARYVGQAIESILGQEYDNFRLYIVDDGSTDGTLDVIKTCAGGDRRVVISSRPRTGYVVALNEMLAQAEGRYLARMDADDIAEPTRFARQVEYLDAHPDCVALGTQVLLVDPDGLPICTTQVPTDHNEIMERMLKGYTTLAHPAVMMRTEAVRAVGGYNPEFYTAEDYDLWLRLGEIGSLACLSEPLLRYRRHPSSVTLSQRHRQVQVKREIWKEYIHRRGYKLPDSHFRISVDDRRTLHERWAADALHHRFYGTARKYSLKGLAHQPLKVGAWSLVVKAFGWSVLSLLPDAQVRWVELWLRRLTRRRSVGPVLQRSKGRIRQMRRHPSSRFEASAHGALRQSQIVEERRDRSSSR